MNRVYCSIASGASLTAEDVDVIRQARASGVIKGVAVTNRAYEVASWADYLVGVDRAFWLGYPDALRFKGGKFSPQSVGSVIRFCPKDYLAGEPSGLYSLRVLRELGADVIVLLGHDLKGGHFHEPHADGMTNPKPRDFDRYKAQFTQFSGCAIINASRDSVLDCFPKMTLEDALAETHRGNIC